MIFVGNESKVVSLRTVFDQFLLKEALLFVSSELSTFMSLYYKFIVNYFEGKLNRSNVEFRPVLSSFLTVFDDRFEVQMDNFRFTRLLTWYVETERLESLEKLISLKSHQSFFGALSQLLANSNEFAFRMTRKMLLSMIFSSAFSESQLIDSLERMNDLKMKCLLLQRVFETGESDLLVAVIESRQLMELVWQLFFLDPIQVDAVRLLTALFGNHEEPSVLEMARQSDKVFLRAISEIKEGNSRELNLAISDLLSNIVSVCSCFDRRQNPLLSLRDQELLICSKLSLFPSEFSDLMSLIWPSR